MKLLKHAAVSLAVWPVLGALSAVVLAAKWWGAR